jgi:hypothetical protein
MTALVRERKRVGEPTAIVLVIVTDTPFFASSSFPNWLPEHGFELFRRHFAHVA